MDEIIYVRLLEEGTIVYRPVKATRKSDNQYVLGEADCEWEVWEFRPNSLVSTEVIKLGPGWSQEPCIVATKIIEGESYIAEGIQNSEVVVNWRIIFPVFWRIIFQNLANYFSKWLLVRTVPGFL